MTPDHPAAGCRCTCSAPPSAAGSRHPATRSCTCARMPCSTRASPSAAASPTASRRQAPPLPPPRGKTTPFGWAPRSPPRTPAHSPATATQHLPARQPTPQRTLRSAAEHWTRACPPAPSTRPNSPIGCGHSPLHRARPPPEQPPAQAQDQDSRPLPALQFGPGPMQQHGFARNLDWQVRAGPRSAAGHPPAGQFAARSAALPARPLQGSAAPAPTCRPTIRTRRWSWC